MIYIKEDIYWKCSACVLRQAMTELSDVRSNQLEMNKISRDHYRSAQVFSCLCERVRKMRKKKQEQAGTFH